MVTFYSKELFPTKQSLVYFILYTTLLVNQGILVTSTKTDNHAYSYNTVTVVLLTECIKLVAVVALYLREKSTAQLITECRANGKVCVLYLVPAALYCLGNNLQFVNLAHYDPATYYVLLQLRVVVTGIVFQVVFKRRLIRVQWVSLVCLTLGCMVKEYGRSNTASSSRGSYFGASGFFDFHLVLIIIQTFCSCFAGVYTEYLLKDTGRDVNVMVQNVFMYVDSIACSVCVLGYQGQLATAFSVTSLSEILHGGVVCLMLNNAAFGIVVSLFLRSLNSIVKTFAGALQLTLTALLCWGIFGIAVDVTTVVAIVIVTVASVVYAQSPVVSKTKME